MTLLRGKERERACDGVLRGRESSWCACDERESACSVWCAERGLRGILISLLFNENFKFSQISILKYFVKMTTF